MKPRPYYHLPSGEHRQRAKRDYCAYVEFYERIRDWKAFLHGVTVAIQCGRVVLGGVTLPDNYRRRDVIATLKTLRAATCPAMGDNEPGTEES